MTGSPSSHFCGACFQGWLALALALAGSRWLAGWLVGETTTTTTTSTYNKKLYSPSLLPSPAGSPVKPASVTSFLRRPPRNIGFRYVVFFGGGSRRRRVW